MENNIHRELDPKNEEEQIGSQNEDQFNEDLEKLDLEDLRTKNKQLFARAKRAEQELKEFKIKPKEKLEDKAPVEKKDGFDWGQKAYLKASGIQPDEYELVEKAIKGSGASLEEVLEDEFFLGRLKNLREAKSVKEASASNAGVNRSFSPARDKVEYWIAKGEMPPLDQPELRRAYVNAKLKVEESKNKFTDRPVA